MGSPGFSLVGSLLSSQAHVISARRFSNVSGVHSCVSLSSLKAITSMNTHKFTSSSGLMLLKERWNAARARSSLAGSARARNANMRTPVMSSSYAKTTGGLQHRLSCRGWAASAAPASSGAGASRAERLTAHAQEAARQKNRDLALYGTAIVVGMVGVTYLSVPLYRMFCQATGFGGTVRRVEGDSVEAKIARGWDLSETDAAKCAERTLTIQFNTDVNGDLDWTFTPTQREVKVHPGQTALAFFTARNNTDRAITGVATYNVTPQKAGSFFAKIQCFCFEEQRLRPHEEVDMPVFFYVDPSIVRERKLEGVDTLMLSYTFFKVSEDDDDEVCEPCLEAKENASAAAAKVGLTVKS